MKLGAVVAFWRAAGPALWFSKDDGFDRRHFVDGAVENGVAKFFYLPFAHSECFADQERSVAPTRRLGEPDLSHSLGHRDIVRGFGRFPHRNLILGRSKTHEEKRFIDNGGFRG